MYSLFEYTVLIQVLVIWLNIFISFDINYNHAKCQIFLSFKFKDYLFYSSVVLNFAKQQSIFIHFKLKQAHLNKKVKKQCCALGVVDLPDA